MEELKKSEERIQSDFVQWFNNNYCLKHHSPRGMIWSVPNEGAKISTKFVIGKMMELIKTPSQSIVIAKQIIEHCKGNSIAGMKAKAMGLMTGVSDCILIYNGKILFLELKTDIGKQSEQQKEFEKRITDNGFLYCLAKSVDEAIKKTQESFNLIKH